MKKILVSFLIYSSAICACDFDQAVYVAEQIHPFFMQIKGHNLTKVGFCDRNTQVSPCCIEIGFVTEQHYSAVKNVFRENLKLFDLTVKFSFGPQKTDDAVYVMRNN
jgi:hypothetical protein